MITLSPIIVFIFSAILLKEKIESMKTFGIISGFIGALILVLYTAKDGRQCSKYSTWKSFIYC